MSAHMVPNLAKPSPGNTIPAYKPLRVGIFRQILKDVAEHTHQTLEMVLEALG